MRGLFSCRKEMEEYSAPEGSAVGAGSSLFGPLEGGDSGAAVSSPD